MTVIDIFSGFLGAGKTTLIKKLIKEGYKNEKMVFKDDFVILKSGIWDITTTYLPIDKIQKVSISQSYFQEKRQIGSLNLYTAAGIITLYYYDFNMLQRMVNEILYKIEKNKVNIYEELEKLEKLKKNGAISDIEFEVEKAKLLK